MDLRLLHYYNQELHYLRELGGEFAKAFPKIAGRLGLDSFECADPYVERLLEGFAFLAARVQLKMDAEFPRFTQHLLAMVYPHYLAPLPSIAVVQMQPDASTGTLNSGFTVPRHSVMHSRLGTDEQTPCDYRTAHDVTLWPIEVTEASYFFGKEPVSFIKSFDQWQIKAGVRLKIRTNVAGLLLSHLSLDKLTFYLHGTDERPALLYEQLIAHALGVALWPTQRPMPWCETLPPAAIQTVGFDDNESLLPYTARSFSGYRLLQEYFACPQRFRFFEISGLQPILRRCQSAEIELVIPLRHSQPRLEQAVEASQFALFCTPAINLFPKRADRIHLTDQVTEHHVVVDRTRPLDFEVYRIQKVVGLGEGGEEQEFLPLYATTDHASQHDLAYYTVHRMPRLTSTRQKQRGPRSSYLGGEVFLTLVDGHCAPYRRDLRQLAVEAWCTNRDLPLHIPIGIGDTDFTLISGAPVASIRVLAGPTKPKPAHPDGEIAWRLISHLTLNYLSLTDNSPEQGAVALRELLALYGDKADAAIAKQIEGVRSINAKSVTRRALTQGPIAFARGLEITVTFDETAFAGSGILGLGAVLEQFFARYVAINSFTETVLATTDRGEIMRWPARMGQRHRL